MDEVVANKHIPVLVAPDRGTRGTPRRWLTSGRASWMRTVLRSEHGHERYRKRKQTVEPLFGNTKHNGGFYRFHRRGRTLRMGTSDPRSKSAYGTNRVAAAALSGPSNASVV